MRCRHTVPDWHRFVVAGEDARPIFAACRLLLTEGERVADPGRIACTYWGRQPCCPVYDGPPVAADTRASKPLDVVTGDVPVTTERVWPVRPPGAVDGHRVVLMVLGALSIVLVGVTVFWALAALGGIVMSSGLVTVLLVAGGVSLTTHFLTLLHLWVRR